MRGVCRTLGTARHDDGDSWTAATALTRLYGMSERCDEADLAAVVPCLRWPGVVSTNKNPKRGLTGHIVAAYSGTRGVLAGVRPKL